MMSEATDKLYYKIGEVCEICEIEPHVLRYWESEFPSLSPSKNKAGQRIYSGKELELIQTIKGLLYEEGYTIAGAIKRLKGDGQPTLSPEAAEVIEEVRQELREMIELLERQPGQAD